MTVNTSVSTLYFAQNSASMFEFRSVATDTQLPLVLKNTSNNMVLSQCSLDSMSVSTTHDGWEDIDADGYTLTSYNGKSVIKVIIIIIIIENF